MLQITTNIYRAVANLLLERIEDGEYFNGRIELDSEDLYCSLLTTLLIRRELSGGPDLDMSLIVEVLPVWWEFHTYQECGEVLNDFSWSEFKQYLV